jgi:hypothetical protein
MKNPKTYRKKEKPVAARTGWHPRSPQSTDTKGSHSVTRSAGDEIATGQKIVGALDRPAWAGNASERADRRSRAEKQPRWQKNWYEFGALLHGPRTGTAKLGKRKSGGKEDLEQGKNENEEQAATRGLKENIQIWWYQEKCKTNSTQQMSKLIFLL